MTADSDAISAIATTRMGDLAGLAQLLSDNPWLAAPKLQIAKGHTPRHVVTDSPGYFPNGPRFAKLLIDAGADVNDRATDSEEGETPLHRAADIDDGADVEMPSGSIGMPLDNAIG